MSFQVFLVTQMGYAMVLRGLVDCDFKGTSLIHRLSVPDLPREAEKPREREIKETDTQSWNERERHTHKDALNTHPGEAASAAMVSISCPWNSQNLLMSLKPGLSQPEHTVENNPWF